MIPPSYSTLTSTPNTPSTPIMCSTAASLTEKSPPANPQRQLSDEVLQQLPEYKSLHRDSTVLHFTGTTPLTHASPLNTSLHQSLNSSSSLPQYTSTFPPLPRSSTQSSSFVPPQTENPCVSSLHASSLPSPLTPLILQLPEQIKQPTLSSRKQGLLSGSQVM